MAGVKKLMDAIYRKLGSYFINFYLIILIKIIQNIPKRLLEYWTKVYNT